MSEAERNWIYNRILYLISEIIKNSSDGRAVEIRELLRTIN